MLLAAVFAVASCTSGGTYADSSSEDRQVVRTPPLGSEDLARLGTGALYVIAGPDHSSGNVWLLDLSKRRSEQLTDNKPPYGISWVSASSAGVVVADARSGIDELGILREDGVELLADGHVVTPSISDSGRIASVRPPDNNTRYFQVEVKPNADARARVVHRQRVSDLASTAWGADERLAVGSRGWPEPGRPEVLIFDKHGKLDRRLRPRLPEVGAPVWSPTAPGIAVWGFGSAEIITLDGEHTKLPNGWRPICWNPDGSGLLMTKGNQIALWRDGALAFKATVRAGGIFECAWLDKPAPTTGR